MIAAEKKINEHRASLTKLKSQHTEIKRKFNKLAEKMENKKKRRTEEMEKKERNNKEEEYCYISTEKLKNCPLCDRRLTKFSKMNYMDNADCPCGVSIKILWDPEIPEVDE